MAINVPSRRARPAGGVEAARTDDPIGDAPPPPGLPAATAASGHPPLPPEGHGLADLLFYAMLAVAHVGGDERERVLGLIYALAALHHALGRR